MNINNITSVRPIVGDGKKVYIETYGCQMNANDSEVVLSILQREGFVYTKQVEQADLILVNTCSIRDNAEQRVWGRLKELSKYRKTNKKLRIGIIGCMAERLKESLLEGEYPVDLVAGPDSYRSLPKLVRETEAGGRGVNVILSTEETYGEISPVRLDANGVSAFISIMRGCNNMCTYCVVPYTRGRERSRDPKTIIREAQELLDAGYKEITLLGQNVNSYKWEGDDNIHDFAELINAVACLSNQVRVRFATSHPKDLSDKLIETIAGNERICRSIHLPAQSGSSRMLELMNRRYTREWYLERIAAIRKAIPDCAITTDIIAGFCSETPEDHELTLSLMREVGYDSAYMFKYSERADTKAARTMKDDIDEATKTARLTEIIELQNKLSLESHRKDVGKVFEILVEGVSKRSDKQMIGRTSQNRVVVFDRADCKIGDYATVKINDCTSATLFGELFTKNL
ncbi:MAG: tRNA (N6-isopentenyl adenosine(37)-C2)-methylthiotransferase MiaB [Rikenellaceae bacterium]